jgi:phosphoesterase RecJ-like protein
MNAQRAPDDLLATIRDGNRFLITSHVSPDGDAIGSSLGLARVVRTLGKGALVWLRDPLPAVYRPLPGAERIHGGAEPPAGFPERFDGVIVLECPGLDRTGLEDRFGGLPLVNVDHHLGNQHYGAINWVDPAAPAAGEMVFRLARALKIDLDADTATLLYLTLVSDTGCFRFANATAAAFEAAAGLVRAGAEPPRVAQWLYQSQPEGMVRLLGEMLGTLEVRAGGRIATAELTPEMFERAGAAEGDSEGLIDVPRSIAGVEAVALCRRRADGAVKVSLRSRGELDVERIARGHGGGGHKNAAGYVVAGGDLAGIRERVLADLVAAVEVGGAAGEPSAGDDADETPAWAEAGETP